MPPKVTERICEVPGCNSLGQHMGKYRIDGSVVRRKHCAKHHHKLYEKKYGKTLITTVANNAGFNTANQYISSIHKYKKYRKDYCENIDSRLGFKCTTTIVDMWYQLETDHIDEDHNNDVEENMQTLCACCHRIKTKYSNNNNGQALNFMLEQIVRSYNDN